MNEWRSQWRAVSSSNSHDRVILGVLFRERAPAVAVATTATEVDAASRLSCEWPRAKKIAGANKPSRCGHIMILLLSCFVSGRRGVARRADAHANNIYFLLPGESLFRAEFSQLIKIGHRGIYIKSP